MESTDKELSDIEESLLTPGEAARRLHITTRTLQRMALRGEVSAIVLPSGHRRYRTRDIEAIKGAA